MQFASPNGLDRFLFETFFRGRRDGVFLDLAREPSPHGAVFARSMGWTVLRAPAGDAADFAARGVGAADYCALSAPAAGAIEAFKAARLLPAVISIANADEGFRAPMAETGYEFVVQLGSDSVFKRADVKRLPQISVICAVWHGDENRAALLKGHAANLARQTVPVEPIYVFDGGDAIPDDLPGRSVTVGRDLTIYQAWNVALSLVATSLVMNLNLDDRLAPDAAETLARELAARNALAAGGDWKICYTQADTDAVEPCYPAERVPFVAGWPPVPGTLRRLGTGTHDFGSLGPATLWRMDAHLDAPRYPWRFADGTPIRMIGDLAWLSMMAKTRRGPIVRVPMIIGHYHSHPGEQAEFRTLPYDERALIADPGVARY